MNYPDPPPTQINSFLYLWEELDPPKFKFHSRSLPTAEAHARTVRRTLEGLVPPSPVKKEKLKFHFGTADTGLDQTHGRVLTMSFILSLFALCAGISAHAYDKPTIVDVRRNITLAEDAPVYKDFYISNSTGSGFKKNLVVTAVRKLNVRDASGANAVGEIIVPVGQLKIIAIYDKVAVAREFTLLSRDELPMLEQIGIMTGDQIDLTGSFIDKSKPRKKVAETAETPVETAKPEETKTPITVAENVKSEKLEKTLVSDNNSRNE